jgi:hypothetical protein
MSETGAELTPEPGASGPALDLGPLPVELLPPAVQKLLAAPTGVKALAARGMAPLRPGELAIAIYQLSFDSNESVQTASGAAPAGLPDKVLAPALAESLPARVLHFFAGRIAPDRIAVLEPILFNLSTADQTFVLLAGRLRERELEVMFQNESRILRCPAILAALYLNPQARMSSLNRAIELCARNGVRVEGLPCFDEVARSIAEDADAKDPAVADSGFSTLLAEAERAAAGEEDPDPSSDSGQEAGQPAGEEAADSKRTSPIIDFSRLKLYEKIRLATLGNAYCRKNLLRDPNRMVALAAIRSPRITDGEIANAAGNRGVCEDVLRYIAGQRDLTKGYQVKLNLVQNPKCPVALSMKFLPFLHAEDLKHLARSKNVPSALAAIARRLVQNRSKKD